MDAPILTQKNMHYLTRALAQRVPGLRGVRADVLRALSLSPAVLALTLARVYPALLEKEEISIVIATGSDLQAIDEGAWYSLVPYMLGRPNLKLDITLIVEVDGFHSITAYNADRIFPRPTRRPMIESTIEDFFASNKKKFDLWAIFHCDLPEYCKGLEPGDGLISRLTGCGERVVGLMMEPGMQRFADELLRLNGLALRNPVANPFEIDSEHEDESEEIALIFGIEHSGEVVSPKPPSKSSVSSRARKRPG